MDCVKFHCNISNSEIVQYKPQKDYSGTVSIIVSTPELSENSEYTLYINETESGTFKTNDVPESNGFGFGGGGKGGNRGDFKPDENMTPPDDFNPDNMTPPEMPNGQPPKKQGEST